MGDDPRYLIDIIQQKVNNGIEDPYEIEDIKRSYSTYFLSRNIPLECIRTMRNLLDALTGDFDANAAYDRLNSINSSDRCSSSMVDDINATIDEQIRQWDVRQSQTEIYAMNNSNLLAEDNYLPSIDEEANNRKNRVYRFLADRCAHKFREIGVNLGAREVEMNTLEAQYPSDSSRRLYELFKYVEADELEGTENFLRRICDALYQERLFELRKQVQRIITLS